jgi:DNA invertase Pin-like site-specific DNA recombinase
MDAQRRAIQQACEARGWELAELLSDVASGKSTNGRRGLARALDRCDQGQAKALVVAKLDRLSRSTLDFAVTVERARRGGWRLVILDPDLDLGTPFGRAMAGVVAVFAQLEREQIGERTRVALAEAKAQGRRLGRPSGLSMKTVDQVVELRGQGLSYRAIAARLTEAGVPTSRGRRRWSAESVRWVYLDAI